MSKENMKHLLGLLVDRQKDTSPIVLSIGYVNKDNIVQHDAVIIKEAAPIVINTLIEYGYNVSVTEQGVRVDKF